MNSLFEYFEILLGMRAPYVPCRELCFFLIRNNRLLHFAGANSHGFYADERIYNLEKKVTICKLYINLQLHDITIHFHA